MSSLDIRSARDWLVTSPLARRQHNPRPPLARFIEETL
jgi:hypothetical protein